MRIGASQTAERVAWLANFGIGLLATSYGAALPALVHDLGRGYAALSLLFVAFAAGNTVTYFLANPLIDRGGVQRVLVAGLATFFAAGLALGLARSFGAWVAATLVMGIAFSLADVSAARLVGALHHQAPAHAMNRLNIYFGIGAIAAPMIVGFSVHLGGGPQPVFLLIALCGGVGAAVLSRLPQPPRRQAETSSRGDSFARYFRQARWLQLLTLMIFFYISAEVGFGAWIAAYVHLRAGLSTAVAALYPSAYQFGLISVRLIVARSLAVLRLERMLALGGLVAAMATLGAALGGANAWLALAGAFLAGVGFSPAFPVALTLASVRGPGREGWTFGAVFSALALAALIAPWAEGQVFGRLPLVALLLTPLSALVMAGCAILLMRSPAAPSDRVPAQNVG